MHLKNSSTVSIIIPVYNGSNYLKEAIESALAQTYKNLEIIVVNDGSDDNGKTEEIAKSYGNKIRYFKKENGGVSTALNYGIDKMNGDYFAWLSHDDVYKPGHIMTQVHNIEKHKNSVTACKTGTLIDGNFYKSKETENLIIYDKPLDHWRQWIYACSILIPKEILLDLGCINEKNKTAQDTELIWNILYKYKIVYFDKVLVYRRVHNEQGFQVDAENNKADSFNLFKNTLETKGIGFFANINGKNKLQVSYLFLILAWEYQKDRRKINNPIPKYIFEKCFEEWPSPLNPCCYCSKVSFLFKQLNWRYYDIRGILAKIYKQLRGRFKNV